MPVRIDHTKLRHQLLDLGYTPLPAAGKVCNVPRWSRIKVDAALIDAWADRDGFVTTAVRVDDDLLALDFDIDDAEVLAEIERRVEKENPELADLMLDMPKRFGGGAKFALFARRASGQYEQYWSKGYYKPQPEIEAANVKRGGGKSDKRPLQRLEVFTGGGSRGRYMTCYGAHTIGPDGEIARSYSWDQNVSLLDYKRDELPALTLKQVKYLVDLVSVVLHDAGWDYEVGSASGRVETTVSYTLLPEMVFETNQGVSASLADLEAHCDAQDFRVSLNFVEPGAINVTRGSVTRNPADGHVQVYDFASATIYRPAVLDVHMVGASLGRALQRNPYTSRDPENESDGADRPFVDVGGGALTEASKYIARYLAGRRHLYNMGGRIVGVLDGALVPMEGERLTVEIGRRVCCRASATSDNNIERLVEVDPSTKLTKMVGSLLIESRFRELRAVTDIPVLRRDGAVIADGYCPETKLVVRADPTLVSAVQEIGTVEDAARAARDALQTLWAPFREFPFVGPLDRGGALAALLTAAIRPVLPTAPAFGFDAPAQGSGKSLLSRSVGTLAGTFKVYAPLPVKDDDEVRKVLLTVLMESPRAAIFDNMLGMLDSGALGALLTSETFSGRVLGTNTALHAPTAVLMLLNGNNLALAGDMPRRVVNVRIDPQADIPHARKFAFDPEEEVRKNRGAMLVAALTLIRAALPHATRGRVGSFEMWDEMVGQTVAWVRDTLDDRFGDPAESIRQAVEFDPRREELNVLLTVLRRSFGNGWFAASEVSSLMGSGGPLAEALDVERHASAKSVGRYLTNRKDGRAGGMTLQHRKDPRTKVAQFRVWSDEDSAEAVVEGTFQRRKDQAAKITTLAAGK